MKTRNMSLKLLLVLVVVLTKWREIFGPITDAALLLLLTLLTELVDWLENVAPHPILSQCETTWACAFSDCMNLLSLLIG